MRGAGSPITVIISNGEENIKSIFEKGRRRFGLTDILGERIFLLPSSVHEFIAVADDGNTDPAFLAEIVRSINRNMVSDRDFLSDSVYRYEKGGGITIAA